MSSSGNDNFSSTSCAGSSSKSPPDQDEVKLASSNPKKPAGRKKFQETRHPIYRGVRQRICGKWVCETREPNKRTRIWLGTYPTLEMAARAHDVAAIALRGSSACLNFADSAWRLPVPASNHPKDIQKAAAEAAEAFRPKQDTGDHTEQEEVVAVNEEEENEMAEEEGLFVDEEYDVFGMPEMLSSMAEGMMLPPPDYIGDDKEDGADLSLWSFK